MPVFKSRPTGLRIIIVGVGKVGTTLVEQLSKEGHDVTIVDKDSRKVEDITGTFDVLGCVGNGASYLTQVEAGIKEADLIIAVTESDELNLLCCTIARQFSGCAAISRVRTPDYSREVGYLREKLGLAMIINPNLEAARQMARILYLPTALEVTSFGHGQAEIVKLKIPEDNILDSMNIAKLGTEISGNILICGVERGGDVFIPAGSFELKAGDIISVIATRKELIAFLKRIGFATNQVKNTMIIGGGRSTYYLASMLIKSGISVKVIEKNRERCEVLNDLLPQAVIINGDGTDTELLKSEGIEQASSFVPLTGIDEQNVMLALHAKKVSKAKLITKINRTSFSDIIGSLDLGSVIYPKYLTSEAIISYVRARKASAGSNVEAMYYLFDERAEALEFKVAEGSKVTGKPLKDLPLKDNLLVAHISRAGEAIIPRGDDIIRAGDTVIVVTLQSGFTDINDILV